MDVQLSDPQFAPVPAKKSPRSLTELVISLKIAKTESDAKVALIIILILVVSVTALVLGFGKSKPASDQLSPDDLIISSVR